MVTLRDACGFGWMAMACRPGKEFRSGDQGSAAGLCELVVAGWRGGLVSCEELSLKRREDRVDPHIWDSCSQAALDLRMPEP